MSAHTPARRDALPSDYPQVLEAAKAAIQTARTRTALAANAEMIRLYWTLGRIILDRQDAEGWGTKVIDQLSADLRIEFPGTKGFSPRNLAYMRAMAAAWPDPAIVQQVAAQLPWGHHMVLLDRLGDQELRNWYAREAIANGWTRAILVNQIKSLVVHFTCTLTGRLGVSSVQSTARMSLSGGVSLSPYPAWALSELRYARP